ncbi:helix-turn-helix family protein [Burkholderia pseudomallei MSHR7498]|uniref:helix-turn-helix domain-containing protein n=1 Tax=Burkholderia pseudomallei TaxID=28450 RepID=UPI000530F8B8|nr:helix-turn-helix transcriptional regulator [Burkholderia pseudomallei]KGS95094.1 helix-turn-helix family protein [Burkholderia pseudomallei MSHR7498]
MTIGELLDAAKRKHGSLGAVAEQMGIEQSRLSKWRSGDRKPDAGEILLLAELAGLPPLETLAEVEQGIDSKHAPAWARALGNLRAAGVTASVTLALATSLMTSTDAKAATVTANSGSDQSRAVDALTESGVAAALAGILSIGGFGFVIHPFRQIHRKPPQRQKACGGFSIESRESWLSGASAIRSDRAVWLQRREPVSVDDALGLFRAPRQSAPWCRSEANVPGFLSRAQPKRLFAGRSVCPLSVTLSS